MIKKYLLLIFSILSFGSFAQNVLSFDEVNDQRVDLSKNFKNYKILKLTDNLEKLSDGTAITIGYKENYTYVLAENKLLSHDYMATIKSNGKTDRKTISELGFDGKYFMNQDVSESNQFIFSSFENSYSIYIKNPSQEFYIQPLKNIVATANADEYVFYLAKDAITELLDCGSKSDDDSHQKKELIPVNKSALAGGCKTLDLAMSIDYTFYNVYGSVNASINRTLDVLNATQVNYRMANGLSDDIVFKVSEHYIVTCDSNCNYWLPSLEIYTNYNNLGAYAANMFTKPYDIKLQWQNQGGTGSVIGLGSYNMCNTSGIAVVKNYPSDLNITRCILSHEIGHNLGCAHDTNIMAAIISLSNSWSAASITTINNSIANLSCLTACAPTACDNKKVSDAVVTVDAVQSKINATWLAETGIDFKVRLYNKTTNTWSAYATFPYPANSTFYNYSQIHCEDIYRVEITPVCTGIDGIPEQIVVRTSGNVLAPELTFNNNMTQAYCGANNLYFSVSAIDAGASPVYQWKVNGNNVGTNSISYTSNTFVNGDVLSCYLTSSATCLTNPNANVSAVLNITTPSVLSVSIAASETTICAGTSITLTATGVNITGQYPFYRWFLNGVGIGGQPTGTGGGTSGPVIMVTPATNGDVYTCNLSDGGNTCHTGNGLDGSANSNSVMITIQNPCTLANNDFSKEDFSIYPNPVNDILNISSQSDISFVEIFNVLGQSVFNQTSNQNNVSIDVSSLSNATYFVKIYSGESYKIQKIVKQ
jgi:hypothetical protein